MMHYINLYFGWTFFIAFTLVVNANKINDDRDHDDAPKGRILATGIARQEKQSPSVPLVSPPILKKKQNPDKWHRSQKTPLTEKQEREGDINTLDLIGDLRLVGDCGFDVDISNDGRNVIVGCPFDDVNGKINAGSVHIYQLTMLDQEGAISQQWQKLITLNGDNANDRTGISVSFAKDNPYIFAVGDPYSNIDGSQHVGRVRVFQLIQDGIGKISYEQIGGDILGEVNEKIGWVINLSGDGEKIVIGANKYSRNGYTKVYTRDSNDKWSKILDFLGENNEGLGYSVALSGDGEKIAVGSPKYSTNDNGQVTIFSIGNKDKIVSVSGSQDYEHFGYSVSLSNDGNRFAVGSPFYKNDNSWCGRVQIFDATSGRQIGNTIEGPNQIRRMGASTCGLNVNLSDGEGNIVIIRCFKEFLVARFDGETWIVEKTYPCYYSLDNAISSTGKAVVIAYRNADRTYGVQVYGNIELPTSSPSSTLSISWDRIKRSYTNNWGQIGEILKPSDEVDFCGFDVDISNDGRNVIVGCPIADVDGKINAGSVHIYQLTMLDQEGAISQQWQKLITLNGDNANDRTGKSVSLAKDNPYIFAVGDPYFGVDGNNDVGRVRVFQLIQDGIGKISYEQIGGDILGKQKVFLDNFGRSTINLSGDGKMILIGGYSPYNTDGYAKVYEFHASNNNWKLVSTFQSQTDERFGYSISMPNDGQKVVVGLPDSDDDNGQVDIFSHGSKSSILSIRGTAKNARFGSSVSFSNDGNRFVAGTPYYDCVTFKYPNCAGRVQIFDSTDGRQIGNNIEGPGGSDHCGLHVKLSNDGNIVIIGCNSKSMIASFDGEVWMIENTISFNNSCFFENGCKVAMSGSGEAVAIGNVYSSFVEGFGSIDMRALPPSLIIPPIGLPQTPNTSTQPSQSPSAQSSLKQGKRSKKKKSTKKKKSESMKKKKIYKKKKKIKKKKSTKKKKKSTKKKSKEKMQE